MPWHIPEDFKFFKSKTMGHALIMGRKTFESIGKPLPGRLSIVVSRQDGLKVATSEQAPALAVRSVEAALAVAHAQAERWGEEVFVIGGGEIYRQTLPMADRVYLTRVHRNVVGDTRYPELDGAFQETESRAGGGEVPCTFKTFERTSPRAK